MNTTDHQVIAELGTLAAREHWSRTGDFLRMLDRDGPRVVLFTAGESGPLVDWLGDQGISPAETRPLTTAEAEPGRLLAADRVVVALSTGHLLDVDEVDAMAAILGSPESIRRIVLIGTAPDTAAAAATDADTAADTDAAAWTAVERSIWRVLLGGTEDWQEQDLGPRGCLRWAPPSDDDEPRVARDRSALLTWLTDTGADLELDRMRAIHALDLAEAEQGHPAPTGTDGPASQARLLSRLGRSRRRITGRLDGLETSVAREASATIDTVRADLVAGIGHEIRVATAGRSDHRLAASVLSAQLDRRTRDWLTGPYTAIGDRVAEAFQDVAVDLDDLDWDAVTDEADLRVRRTSVTAVLRAAPRLSVPAPRLMSTSLVPAAGNQTTALLPFVGAVVGAAVGAILPIPLLTSAAGATLGVIGGRAAQQQRTGAAMETWINRNVPDAVSRVLTPLRESALERLRAVIAERRAEAVGLLDDLERHLRRRKQSAEPGPDHQSSLAALRSSLS